MISPNELPPANGLAKIIILRHRNERGEPSTFIFCREDTGLIIGAVQNGLAQWGIGQGIQQWLFKDTDCACDYIKECCHEYLGREDVDFLTQDADRLIQTPGMGGPPRRM